METVQNFLPANSTNSLIIREGDALELKQPNKISISGNIDTVANFLKQRYTSGRKGYHLQEVDVDRAVITVDEEKNTILLQVDPENYFGAEVLSKLEMSQELSQFCINQNTTFKREQLIKLIRFNRAYFDSPETHAKVLGAYEKLAIKTASEIKAETDLRGNKSFGYNKSVNSEGIPTSFVLNVPIFKGQPKEKITVDICLEASDKDVVFWFESVELAEKMIERRDELFNLQLTGLTEFVVVKK